MDHLCQRVPTSNHKLYFDNYFTTCNLLEILTDKKILAAGTVESTVLLTPPLETEKQIKRTKERKVKQ